MDSFVQSRHVNLYMALLSKLVFFKFILSLDNVIYFEGCCEAVS